VLDRAGNIVVACLESNNGLKIYLERWTGTGWQSFGPGVPTNVGLFTIVFDSTNSPFVIIPTSLDSDGGLNGCVGDSVILRRNSTTAKWTTLRTGFATRDIAADKNGFVYASIYNQVTGNNGRNWERFSTFQQNNAICELAFNRSDNLVATWYDLRSENSSWVFSTYNGEGWSDQRYNPWNLRSPYTFDKNNRLVTHQPFNGGQQVTRGDQNLSTPFFEQFIQSIAVDKVNRPIIITSFYGSDQERDIFAKRWTGTTWTNLGGAIDRVTTRSTDNGNLLVDGNGTIYAAWQECVGIFSSSPYGCTNNNIYVSKFVP
jgi:hypothetical protein